MKLSDMFSNLAENARSFEKQANEWQQQLSSSNDDMLDGARKWQQAAMERQEELNKQMQGYFEEANDNIRTQWATMQSAWDEQLQKLRDQGEEMRKTAQSKGDDVAGWSEAYAAQMVAFAQKMQEEAASAIAAATEARSKSAPTKKK